MATAKKDLTGNRVQGRPYINRRDNQLLSLQQLAEFLEVSSATIYYWRYQGTGPKGHKVGKHVRYWLSDVLDWLEEQADCGSSY
jgi:predicted DNA-binding transcriptional regulator AlpA